jgi:oligopeptide transport system substrate-binding protein
MLHCALVLKINRLKETAMQGENPWRVAIRRALKRLCATSAALLVAVSPFQASAQPDPNKVLRIAFPVAETGFDPVKVHDLYSSEVVNVIFENLLTYDYLASPPKLVPGVAQAMPTIADDGKTYTFKLKPGRFFAPDPAFKAQKRELVADDVIFSLKRHMDVKLKPVWKFLLDGKIVGLDELSEAGKKAGKFDYDAPVEGLKALDKYTVQIKLKQTDHNFGFILAHTPLVIVAREVIEAAGDDTNARPIGTGPYRIAKWTRGSKIELDVNPNYPTFEWNFTSTAPEDQPIIAAMKGKKMPLIGRVEISIITEDQPALLAFKGKSLDYWNLRPSVANQVMDGDKLKAEEVKNGISVQRYTEPEITYHYINMQDPVFGGLEKEKIALRRAIWMAWDNAQQLQILRKGQALTAHYIVPPGVAGHNPNHKGNVAFDPDFANKLLDRFGYKKGADGFRTQPNGQPMVLKYTQDPTDLGRSFAELFEKGLKAIGVKMEFDPMPFAEALKKEKECKLQMRGAAWIADYPDGDNFMMLLYGPNTGESNNACFKFAEYDKIYEKSRLLPNGPERDKLYADLQRIMEVYAPWRLDDTRVRNMLYHSNVKGFKKHPILHGAYHYFDVEKR